MKKLRILVILFILAFSFDVKAEVFLEFDCKDKEITSDKSVKCEGWLNYETEGVSDIEFNFDTNLDINFSSIKGFTNTISGNKISIHSKKPLYDEIGFSAKIFEFTLSSNDKCNEKEKVSLKNFKINNTSDIKIDDVSETFTVSIPKKEVIIEQTPSITPRPTPKVEIKKSNICTLDSITIDGKLISSFNKNILEYKDINVNNDVVFVKAVRSHELSSASGLGDVPVPRGETIERDIVVIAEDDTKCVYKLFITNTLPKPTSTPEEIVLPDEEEKKSSDNTLKSLEIYSNKKKVNFKFDNKKDKFDITLDDTYKITIKATLNDSKASFDNKFGPRDVTLDLEDNEVLIKVKAENGDEKTYTLNIHVNKKNSDNTLSSLKINDKEINLNDEKLEISLPNEVTRTKIEAVASDDKATINYEDVDLKVGDNEVNIEVTSEDGNNKEYDVNVIREEEKIIFEKLEVVGYNLDFSKDKKSYTLKVDKNINELEINVVPSNLSLEVLNNKNLRNGRKISIKVIDSENTYEYSILIQKDSSFLNTVCYVVFGIGIISLVGSIIYVIKKKKHK